MAIYAEYKLGLISMALLAFASPVSAQNTQQRVDVVFSGTITQDHTTTASATPGVLADGTTFNPNFSGAQYNIGDPISFSFSALLPTVFYFESLGIQPTNGFYNIFAGTSYYTGGTSANITTADVSGAITPILNAGQPTNTRAQFVLDATTGQYSLATGLQGNANTVAASGTLDGPSFFFDPDTQSFTAAPSSCLNASRTSCLLGGDGGFGLIATATTIAMNGIGFHTEDPNFPGSYYRSGVYSIAANGNWNLPVFGSTSGNTTSGNPGSSGNPTDVPAPSVLFLIAAGLAATGWRTRKRASR